MTVSGSGCNQPFGLTSNLPTRHQGGTLVTQMNELGFYTLAGAPESPRELIDEVRQAEELGIGNVFISERNVPPGVRDLVRHENLPGIFIVNAT